MNKKVLFAASVVVLVGGLALFLCWYPATLKIGPSTEKEMNEKAKQLGIRTPPSVDVARSLDPSRAVRVAIGTLGLADQNQNRNAGDLVLAELKGAHGLEMVERQE